MLNLRQNLDRRSGRCEKCSKPNEKSVSLDGRTPGGCVGADGCVVRSRGMGHCGPGGLLRSLPLWVRYNGTVRHRRGLVKARLGWYVAGAGSRYRTRAVIWLAVGAMCRASHADACPWRPLSSRNLSAGVLCVTRRARVRAAPPFTAIVEAFAWSRGGRPNMYLSTRCSRAGEAVASRPRPATSRTECGGRNELSDCLLTCGTPHNPPPGKICTAQARPG